MKKIEIDVTANLEYVDFAPDNLLAEIIQNIKTILTTKMGSVPLDRDFGIDPSLIDLPMSLIKSQLTREVKQKIEKYEPRAQFAGISWSGNGQTGKVYPTVKVVIIGE